MTNHHHSLTRRLQQTGSRQERGKFRRVYLNTNLPVRVSKVTRAHGYRGCRKKLETFHPPPEESYTDVLHHCWRPTQCGHPELPIWSPWSLDAHNMWPNIACQGNGGTNRSIGWKHVAFVRAWCCSSQCTSQSL